MTNRYSFEGLRVAVLGMGVSGLSAALTLRKLGAEPTVFDQKPPDNPEVVRVSDQLHRDDIEAISGWHGRMDPDKFDLMIVSPGFRRDHPAVRDFKGKPVISEVEFAYRIAEAEWPEVYAYLREREQPTETYFEAWREVRLEDGKPVPALVFLSDAAHSQWAGALSLEQQAELIAGSAGLSGRNIDYLRDLVLHLREDGVRDQAMERLLAMVEAREAAA